MNIQKRRRTAIKGRDQVQKLIRKPLLENMDALRPEYETSDEVKLYEMTLKKHRDTDKIPVPIAMFG